MGFIFYLVCVVTLITAFSPQAFAQYGEAWAKIKHVPPISIPEAAKESGIGGEVRVRVNVDVEGNVASVEGAFGPGAICNHATRADVIALRNAAKEAAKGAKFEPVERDGKRQPSVAWVRFEIPERESSQGKENIERVRLSDGKEGDGDPKGPLNNKVLSLPKPAYPPAARALRASGPVTVEVLIDENGDVFSSRPVSGHPLLRFSASEAGCNARFTPTLLDGTPVKVVGKLTYNFVP